MDRKNTRHLPLQHYGACFLRQASPTILPSPNHPQNKVHRPVDPIARRVDAKVIVIGIAPCPSCIEVVISGVLVIQAVKEAARLLLV